MMNSLKSQHLKLAHEFREVGGRVSFVALILGVAVILLSIGFGRSYAYFLPFLVFSFIITWLWRKAPRPWTWLVLVSAAAPLGIGRHNFQPNLIFAAWFAIFNSRYLFRLPRWLYLLTGLSLLGVLSSSINWASGDFVGSTLKQGAWVFNLLLPPLFLLPLLYFRMSQSRDSAANLQGLVLCLIVPSTLILVLAKSVGIVANEWEASLHVQMLPEGFLQYRLGKVIVSFLRTEVGFILAALICASAAVLVSQVRGAYRMVAAVCLVANLFLLLSTGSFGSGFAAICGLAVVTFKQFGSISFKKVLASLIVVSLTVMLTYSLSPASTKQYLAKRFEHRVTKADTDRLTLWGRATESFFRHPEGVGLTMSAGDRVKSYIHNEYLVYAVSYGLFGGLGYILLVLKLIVSFLRVRLKTIADSSTRAIHLAGLGVIIAISANSMTDHLNANRWYFNVAWSLIWYCYFCGIGANVATPSARGNANRSAFRMLNANAGEAVKV